jgi:hypothetical protein
MGVSFFSGGQLHFEAVAGAARRKGEQAWGQATPGACTLIHKDFRKFRGCGAMQEAPALRPTGRFCPADSAGRVLIGPSARQGRPARLDTARAAL